MEFIEQQSLFLDKTLSTVQRKNILYKCFKQFEQNALKNNALSATHLLEKLKIVLKGEVLQNLDMFIFNN